MSALSRLLLALVAASASAQRASHANEECSTWDQKPGRCARLADCEVDFQDMAHLSRAPCAWSSHERGVCCPLTGMIGQENKKFCPEREGNVTKEHLNQVCMKCQMVMNQRRETERKLRERGIVPARGGSQMSHSRMFPTRPDTLALMHSSSTTLEVSRHLATQMRNCYNSSAATIDGMIEALPPVDQTELRKCPRPPVCPGALQKYRTADGSCNNAQNPDWGQANSAFIRLLPPEYGDGMQEFRRQKNTSELPGARYLSTSTIVTTSEAKYENFTLLLMQWGQFLDHDLTHTPIEKHNDERGSDIRCCTEDGKYLQDETDVHPSCAPINVKPTDTFYASHGVDCLNFVRSATRTDCKFPKKKEQMNALTAFIDASNVYGSSEHEESLLRTFNNDGKMITNNHNADNLLPELPPEESAECRNALPNMPCFRAGDGRVNEQTNLVVMHTIFVQYHNILASRLKLLNPRWNGNTTYQETRRLIGAMMQHITYAEYLPIVLGENKMRYLGMLPLPATSDQYKDTYDVLVNPTISNVFATSAFRYGHTLVDSQMQGLSRFGSKTLNERLSAVQFDVSALYQKGAIENQLRGLTRLLAPKFDNLFSPEITQFLFKGEKPFGMDLVALNLQRGRDHGLPGYSKWREYCGKPAATTFDDLNDVMHRRTTDYMREYLYNDVEDIDIFLGHSLEENFDDALVGHTLICLLSDQFYRLQRGDRFYYENGGFPNSFTPAQLQELRRSSLRQVMCAVSPNLQLQPNVFLVANAENRRASCSILPSFNLDAWKE